MKKLVKTAMAPLLLGSFVFLTACSDSKSPDESEASSLISWIANKLGDSAEKSAQKAKDSADISAFLEGFSGDVYHTLNIEASKAKLAPFNIAACRADNSCSLQADAGLSSSSFAYKTVLYKEIPVQIWAFRAGNLVNNGENGWDRWRVLGCHNLEAGKGQKKVRFTNTAWIGPLADAKPGCLPD